MSSAVPTADQLAAHLIPLHGESWALWRQAALRGAGFPVTEVLELAATAAAAAADRQLDLEAEVDNARRGAVEAVRGALDTLKRQGQWDDKARRRGLLKALAKLHKRKIPNRSVALPEIETLAAAARRLDSAQSELDAVFDAAVVRQSERLREVARNPRFQEAVLWQNRQAFHSAVRKVAAAKLSESPLGSQHRQHEELVAMYLQRYTVKNDTIGYFGPVGWARFVDDDMAIVARPGPELIAERNVYLESWGVEQVAAVLARLQPVRPWLRPRRLPYVRLAGQNLQVPTAEPMPISTVTKALFEACDGARPAHLIAQQLIADPRSGLTDADEVYGLLSQLAEQQVVAWGFHLPPKPRVERDLLRQIQAIEDPRARAVGMKAVAELERARRRIAAAAGDVEQLDQALEHLDSFFTRLTRSDATRSPGATYVGRTLAYEDCRRDLEIELGRPVRSAIAEPLAMLLMSLRWCTQQVAGAFREQAQVIFDELRGDRSSVPAIDFWARIKSWMSEQHNPHVASVIDALHQRWRRVLAPAPDQRRLQLTCDELRDRVAEAFEAPAPGWQQALYHSPDLLIAATDVDAVASGDFEVVVGEIHAAFNTLSCWLFLNQHPDPDCLRANIAEDLSDSGVWIARDKNAGPSRLAWVPPPEHLHIVPPSDHVLDLPGYQLLEPGDLVIAQTTEGLQLQSRNGDLSIDVTEATGPFLSSKVGHALDLAGDHAHWPRITVDRLVISRERWFFDARDLDFVACKNPRERFLATRRWARAHGLPRFLFVSTPLEQKPFYLDLDTLVYIDHLAKQLRRLRAKSNDASEIEDQSVDTRIKVSEMLPRPDQAWLPDAAGRRYASEFRMVVTDQSRRARAADNLRR